MSGINFRDKEDQRRSYHFRTFGWLAFTTLSIASVVFPVSEVIAGAISEPFRGCVIRSIARVEKPATWPLSAWSYQISDTWVHLFQGGGLRPHGRVVEIAPGSSPKVGAALKEIGFRGTLYVIEPDLTALQTVTGIYKEILPHAKIVPLQVKLADAAPMIKTNVDAVIATHPLDDMIPAGLRSAPFDLADQLSSGGDYSIYRDGKRFDLGDL